MSLNLTLRKPISYIIQNFPKFKLGTKCPLVAARLSYHDLDITGGTLRVRLLYQQTSREQYLILISCFMKANLSSWDYLCTLLCFSYNLTLFSTLDVCTDLKSLLQLTRSTGINRVQACHSTDNW